MGPLLIEIKTICKLNSVSKCLFFSLLHFIVQLISVELVIVVVIVLARSI